MKKLNIYSIVFARCLILLVGLIFAAFFFVLFVLGQIGELYLKHLLAFTASTKALFVAFDHELKKAK